MGLELASGVSCRRVDLESRIHLVVQVVQVAQGVLRLACLVGPEVACHMSVCGCERRVGVD